MPLPQFCSSRPKEKARDLIRSELWINSATGVALVQAGYFVKTCSTGIRRLEMVRNTKLRDGSPSSRIPALLLRRTPRERAM
jgi:hypothetical protein